MGGTNFICNYNATKIIETLADAVFHITSCNRS